MNKRIHFFSILLLNLFFIACKSVPEIDVNEQIIRGGKLSSFVGNPDYYIFIRLYNPEYNNPLCIENTLKNMIAIIDVSDQSYSHSAIGFSLNDNFFGLTTAGKRDLKLEQCSNTKNNAYMEKCNSSKSTQTTCAIKVTKKEYQTAQAIVKFFYDKNISYDVRQNFAITPFELNRKFFVKKESQKLEELGNEKFYDDPTTYRDNFICSSFVSYVLINSVESIKTFFEENKLNFNYIIPSDLKSFPGVEELFSSTWDLYEEEALKFVENSNYFTKESAN